MFKFPKIIKETPREKMERYEKMMSNQESRKKMWGGSLGGKTHVWEYVEDLNPKFTQLTGGKKRSKKTKKTTKKKTNKTKKSKK